MLRDVLQVIFRRTMGRTDRGRTTTTDGRGRTDRRRTTTTGRTTGRTDGQRTDDDDDGRTGRTDRGRTTTGRTTGRTDRPWTTTTGHDGTRRDGRREDIHLYMIIKLQIEHCDQVSNVEINRPSTLRFRHPQSNPAG